MIKKSHFKKEFTVGKYSKSRVRVLTLHVLGQIKFPKILFSDIFHRYSNFPVFS